MKLIKINTDNYIVASDETLEDYDIRDTDPYLSPKGIRYYRDLVTVVNKKDCRRIIYSTEPLGSKGLYAGIKELSLQEVKELIGEVDLEKKAFEYTSVSQAHRRGFIDGYNQALEDNKEKKYTEEDLAEAILRTIDACNKAQKDSYGELEIDEEAIIQSLQLKTEWEVEIVDGKLKLK